MPDLPRLWFGTALTVDRRRYFWSGLALTVLKFAGDDYLVRLATGKSWRFLDYISPSEMRHLEAAEGAPQWLLLALAAWCLPFIWVGASMTLRRLLDARQSPWWVLGFFVPAVNLALMLALCCWPSRREQKLDVWSREAAPRLTAALQGVIAGSAVGAVSMALHLVLFRRYSGLVFLVAPLVMGLAAGFLYNRHVRREDTAALGMLTMTVAGLASLLFAAEDLGLLIVALPLLMPAGALAAVAGQLIAAEYRDSKPALPG